MPKYGPILIIGALATVFLAGCASTPDPYPDVPRDLITRDMLRQAQETGAVNALDAVRRYRPMWLRTTRGQDSFVSQGRRGLRVYLDEVQYGGVSSLRDMDLRTIEELHFLDKREATTRFGTDHAEGAILVVSRRGTS